MKVGGYVKMKKMIFIILAVIAVASLAFYYGFKLKESQYNQFGNEGYIISTSSNNDNLSSTRYYFNSTTKYKKDYNKNVVFENTDNNEVKVEADSFVHYINGSVSVLKKTAILDLDALKNRKDENSIIHYYNLFEGNVLNKVGNKYTIKNNNQTIDFTNFIIKSSENKYLLSASNMSLRVAETEKKIENNFIEIQIFDGNIVRFENQEVKYQNISSIMYIEVGENIKINLADKFIYIDGKPVLSLESITIDSNDNIEISETKPEETENPQNEEENNNKEDPLDGLNNGQIIVEGNDNEEKVNENEKVTSPIFSITDVNVTSNKFEADIYIEDPDSLLIGDINIKIINLANNRIVYQDQKMDGNTNFSISVENLDADTNYIFVVSSNYTYNNQTYTKDFIQRTFVTESIGVKLEKNYFTTNVLSFNIVKQSFSRVSKVDVSLMDSNNQIIASEQVELLLESSEVTFDNLTTNKEYKVVISNFLYDNAIISDKFDIQATYKTLKEKPSLGQTMFTIDKKAATFTMNISNVNDPQNGIIGYQYRVYDARNIDEENPILVIDKNGKTSAELIVDNTNIKREVPYVFKLVAIFNDNEKTYEYTSDFSQPMKMDGVEFPTVRFNQTNVTFERIEGNIIINDSGNTLNLNDGSIMTIVYSDSVGNTKTMTSSGNLNIPFSVNNLRKNETYTISVYARVDLQDGNPVIDNCFVGSVVVQTQDTSPFYLNYNVDTTNITEAFLINARLMSADPSVDTTLEANTLTGLVFNLYQGNSTSGTLLKSIRKVDRNLEYYISELKDSYYDAEFVINPSLFGLKNSDLQAEYYTIEVTSAYDYTTYKNVIEIKNNVIVIETGNALPDLPSNPDDSIDNSVIRNKDAKDKYRSDLKADTIVGYRIRASYDNSSMTAKKINYFIHNAKGEIIATETYTVPSSGIIEYYEFWLNDGTAYNVIDDDFRRGNVYYFSYTVDLDLNLDGVIDAHFPTDNIVLRSINVTPAKEEPTFTLYPATSTANSFIWKYTYKDIDSVLVDKKLYYKIDSTEKGSVDISETNNYVAATLSNLGKGNLTIYSKNALIKSASEVKSNNLIYQYFDGLYATPNVNYSLSLEKNRVLINLENYDNNADFYKRVTGAKVVFTANNKTIELDKLTIDNGFIIIDLALIEEMLGVNVSTEVYLYYDNGLTGYELSGSYFSLQMITNSMYNGEYYSFDGNMVFKTNAYATKSFFQYNFDLNNKKLILTDLYQNKNKTVDVTIDSSGISSNYEHMLLKQNSLTNVKCVGSNQFLFDMIIPGISLADENMQSMIVPSLFGATVNFDIYGNASSQMKDNKIYVEVYKTDENGLTSELIQTLEVDVALKTFNIDNLLSKTNYYLKIYADIYNGTNYIRTQLYDIDFQTNNKLYYFKTLGDIGISNMAIVYGATSYQNKYFTLTYKLSQIIGYDRIAYEFYKITYDVNGQIIKTKVDINIADDHVFTTNMQKNISIAPDLGVETSLNYQIVVKAYKTIGDTSEEIELSDEATSTITFNFDRLALPYVGVTSYKGENSVNFNVRFFDNKKVVVDDQYKIKIYDQDKNDVTPLAYQDKYYSTDNYNQVFTLTNVKEKQKYEIVIEYKVNIINGIDTFETKTKSYVTTAINISEISIGEVEVVADSTERNKMRLVFYNSNKLTNITKIRYSIYNSNNYAIDNEITFTPTYITTDNDYYYTFVLPENLNNVGKYYLQLQFLDDSGVVADYALEYNYIK